MSASTKLVDKLEGVDNFSAWKYRIALILEENDLARFIKENVLEPTDATTKEKYQKDMVRAKRIIVDSIKDHLIPQVASKDTPKKMFDSLTILYEGRNINRKMNLRTQLKNTKMQKGETVHEYFSRIFQFKKQLEAIGDTLDEDELIMRALNGLTRPWDAFILMVCGPMPSTSLSGYVYYVSFIDDYSRKTWVYFLKSKDEMFGKFKEFKGFIENLAERKIKILRSDNGGEYTSKEFVSFCRDVRIKRELTTPYNPQQNGVAERKNKTIMEAMKTMIHDQDFPMHLWAEAARTIVYVQNKLSHIALGFKTPKEMFSERS
jgi:hypothetical protein